VPARVARGESAAPAIATAADWHWYAVDELGTADVTSTGTLTSACHGNVQAWQKVELLPGDGMLYLTEVNCAERNYFIKRVSAVKMTPANLKLIAVAEEAPGAWMDFKPDRLRRAHV